MFVNILFYFNTNRKIHCNTHCAIYDNNNRCNNTNLNINKINIEHNINKINNHINIDKINVNNCNNQNCNCHIYCNTY